MNCEKVKIDAEFYAGLIAQEYIRKKHPLKRSWVWIFENTNFKRDSLNFSDEEIYEVMCGAYYKITSNDKYRGYRFEDFQKFISNGCEDIGFLADFFDLENLAKSKNISEGMRRRIYAHMLLA